MVTFSNTDVFSHPSSRSFVCSTFVILVQTSPNYSLALSSTCFKKLPSCCKMIFSTHRHSVRLQVCGLGHHAPLLRDPHPGRTAVLDRPSSVSLVHLKASTSFFCPFNIWFVYTSDFARAGRSELSLVHLTHRL